jgi:hypothetical protein
MADNALTRGLFSRYQPASQNALANAYPQQGNALSQSLVPPAPSVLDYAYQAWKQQHGLRETSDYDLRGAFNSGLHPDERGHLDDTFKRPNHITFSTDSQYSTPQEQGGVWQQLPGGKWSFTPGPANLRRYSPQQLQAYFQQYEPDSILNLPRR